MRLVAEIPSLDWLDVLFRLGRRRRPRRGDRPRARARREGGRTAHAHARLARLRPLHDGRRLRVPRLPDRRRRDRPHRPEPHRRAGRDRHRLPRRGRDLPPGLHGPRPDDGGESLGRGRRRDGLGRRVLEGGGGGHRRRDRQPAAARVAEGARDPAARGGPPLGRARRGRVGRPGDRGAGERRRPARPQPGRRAGSRSRCGSDRDQRTRRAGDRSPPSTTSGKPAGNADPLLAQRAQAA